MFEDIFAAIPYAAIAVLTVFIIFFLFLVYQSRAAPASGHVLGSYEINGRYAGGKFFKRIQGILVDATGIFVNPEVESVFKQLLIEDIKAATHKVLGEKAAIMEQNKETMTTPNAVQDKENTSLQTLVATLEKDGLPLSKVCRIIITRTNLFEKHVIIQYGRVEILPTYAAHEAESRFSPSLGPVSKGIINGSILTLPERWEIFEVGKATVHVFLPDNPSESKFSDAEIQKLPHLAKIALFVPATLSIKEQLKSKDLQLKEREKELGNMGRQLAAVTTELDVYRTAVKGFRTEDGKTPEVLLPKKLDILDTVMIALPTVAAALVLGALVNQPIVGSIVGLFIGLGFVFRRK